jgi:hypothetical protein
MAEEVLNFANFAFVVPSATGGRSDRSNKLAVKIDSGGPASVDLGGRQAARLKFAGGQIGQT